MRNQFPGEFQNDAPGNLRADARDLGERFAVSGVRRHADGLGIVDGEDREGEPRTHAADTEQNVENFPFVVAREAEQGQGILPDDQGGEKLPLLAGPQLAERLRRRVNAHAGTVEVDDGGGQSDVRHGSAEKTNQGRAPELRAGKEPTIRTYLRIP